MKKGRFLLCLILLIMPALVKAEDVEYTLYDSNIKVNQNRTIDVVEKYKVYFIENTSKTTRSLETSYNILRTNKKKKYSTALISDISSSVGIDVKKNRNQKLISFDVKGQQDSVKEYDLKYHFNMGKDELRGKDEFYYDIVKNLDAPISNFTFSIEFPTNIEGYKIYFGLDGRYGLSEDDISYEVKGNKITGTLNILLSNNQSLSLYAILPEGYFKGATDNFNYRNYLYLIFPFICIIITFMFYKKYGRGISLRVKRKDVIYNNFDSAEIGYLYKGKMEEMDLTSLVLYLATKGYLKIVEHDDGYKLGKENTFHFEKIKDYDKNNAAQELICNQLFRDRDKTELKDIEYHFADTYKEAYHMLENEDNHNKLFFKGIIKIKLFIATLLMGILFLSNYRSIYLLTDSYLLVIPLVLFIMFGLYVVFVSNMQTTLKGIIGLVVLGLSVYLGVNPIIGQTHYLIIYAIEFVMVFIMTYLFTKLSDRTEFGSLVLNETYGFKYYLETITKDELTKKIEENPNYFFDMVPYACTLNALEEWIRRGKDIVTEPPEWYVPSSEFRLKDFEQFINNVLYTTSLVMMKQSYLNSNLVSYEEKKESEDTNEEKKQQ